MSDVMTHVSSATSTASSEWLRAVRHINEVGALNVRDICAVVGNPVGGVIGAARPGVETTYRNAIDG